MILPEIVQLSGNRIAFTGFEARAIDGLLDGKRTVWVNFVVQGRGKNLAHVERVYSREVRVEKVMMHDLVFAHMQEKLPACIVAFGICIEPAGNREAEVGEAAKGADRPLRGNHHIPSGTTGTSGYDNAASHRRITQTVNRIELDGTREPGQVRRERIGLATEHKPQVATKISAGHESKPACRQLHANLVAIHMAGGAIAIRQRGS